MSLPPYPIEPPSLVNECDFDGLYRAIQRKFSFVERRRSPFLLGIIGSAVAFLRYSYKVLVHFSVAVLIVKDQDGEPALRQVLENDLGAHRLGINLYSLLTESLRWVVRETLGVLKESNSDLSLGVSRPSNANGQRSCILCLRGRRPRLPQQNCDNGGESCKPSDAESYSVHLIFPFFLHIRWGVLAGMGRLSSIDNHLRARHVGVVVRGENECKRSDFLGFRHPFEARHMRL